MCQRKDLGYIASEVNYLKYYYLKSETYSKGEIDGRLDDKAEKSEIPSKVSDLTNDSGFITNSDLAGLATEAYVESKIGDIDTILSNVALESEAI